MLRGGKGGAAGKGSRRDGTAGIGRGGTKRPRRRPGLSPTEVLGRALGYPIRAGGAALSLRSPPKP